MAINPAVGDAGVFFIDAAAHASGIGVPARLIALHSGDTTCSIVTQGDPPIPYGPVTSPFPWTANAAEVSLTPSGAGYYFRLTEAVESLDVSVVAAQSTATTALGAAQVATAAGGANGTPFPLIQEIPGAWSYDPGIGGWHERFAAETMSIFVEAPLEVSSYTFFFKDVSGGPLGFNVWEDDAVTFPTIPSFSLIGTAPATAADGNYQTLTLPISSSGNPSRHRIDVTTGLVNGGATIPTHYQLLQLRRTLA